MDKPDCYTCQYRGDVPGSAHSTCHHPAYATVLASPLGEVMAILGSVGRVPGRQTIVEGIMVKGNAHGIRHGWFNHPYNFDPVWLEECSGFTAKNNKLEVRAERGD